MSSIQITDISTFRNSTWTKELLFNPFSRDLVLALDFNLSADIAATQNVEVRVTYEIIELRTNAVAFYRTIDYNIPFGWQYLYSILGPLTPHDLGLVWVAGDIFGFRASVEASYFSGGAGYLSFNALAVSDVSWFRLEDLAMV